MKGFIYRLGISIKELGEQYKLRGIVVLGLRIKESV